jgi:hypothetical protein
VRTAALVLVVACAEPAMKPAPIVWPTCDDDPRATPESLADKAAGYDARLASLHVGPHTPWVLDVAIAAGVDPEAATANDVVAWRSGENDGLWSALAMAAEAYRFATTHDPAARDVLATLLAGERQRMQITGVPGLFVRQLIPPRVTGLACPTDPALYTPSADKTANRWVAIDAAGCADVADATGALQPTSHCGLAAFAGWCFLDNISQDEYVGHVFALGAVARLVDDPELNAIAVDLLDQLGNHLVAHGMEFVDWDGRPTQWGKVHPGAGGDSDGYLAVLGASFLATAARGTGDAALASAYDQLGATGYLDQIAIWSGPDGCTSNWNDLSMLTASFHDLLWQDADSARRAAYAAALDAVLVQAPRGVLVEHDVWYELLWASQASGDRTAAVKDAMCQLHEFPRSNHAVARDASALAPAACTGRSGESLAAAPFSIADRCAATFAWWGDPYERRACASDPTLVMQPAGYLLPYWMARYYGFTEK